MLSDTSPYSTKDEVQARIYESAVESEPEGFNRAGGVGLVSVGSISRGEWTAIRYGEKIHLPGDIEFLAVIVDGAPIKTITMEVEAWEEALRRKLESTGLYGKVEITPAYRRYFLHLRHSIFAAELCAHARVISGNHAIDRGKVIPESVPKDDGVRMVGNRAVELLALWNLGRLDPDGVTYPIDSRYILIKLWLDILTVSTVISGQFRPSYTERAGMLCGGIRPELLKILEAVGDPESLSRTILASTEFKCSGILEKADAEKRMDAIFQDTFENELLKIAAAMLNLWSLGMSIVTGTKAEPVGSNSDDWIRAAHKACFLGQSWVKEWARFILICRRKGTPLTLTRLASVSRHGTPKGLVYAAAVGALQRAATDRFREKEIDRHAFDMLPLAPETGIAASTRAFAGEVHRNWAHHLRNN